MGLRYNFRFGGGYQGGATNQGGAGNPDGGNTGGGGREDAESQYGGAYNVGYRSQDNRSGREQVYGAGAGAETTPMTEVDLLEDFKPEQVQPLFNQPTTVANFFAPKPKPYQTVSTIRDPNFDRIRDLASRNLDLYEEEEESGILGGLKELLSNTLIGKGIGYLKQQYDKQKAKDLFANTMDPSPPPVDTIASLTAGLGGGEGQGLASIYTGPPALRPVSTVVEEEEVVDPRTAEMEAFREILRRNLGLI